MNRTTSSTGSGQSRSRAKDSGAEGKRTGKGAPRRAKHRIAATPHLKAEDSCSECPECSGTCRQIEEDLESGNKVIRESNTALMRVAGGPSSPKAVCIIIEQDNGRAMIWSGYIEMNLDEANKNEEGNIFEALGMTRDGALGGSAFRNAPPAQEGGICS